MPSAVKKRVVTFKLYHIFLGRRNRSYKTVWSTSHNWKVAIRAYVWRCLSLGFTVFCWKSCLGLISYSWFIIGRVTQKGELWSNSWKIDLPFSI